MFHDSNGYNHHLPHAPIVSSFFFGVNRTHKREAKRQDAKPEAQNDDIVDEPQPQAMMNLRSCSRPLILLFGDSITQQGFGWPPSSVGWVSLLSRDYSRRADILNRGFSGYNTDHAVEILPNVIPARGGDSFQDEVLFATIFFGANDAALPGELQHVPLERYRQNLSTITKHMKENLKPWRQCQPNDDKDPQQQQQQLRHQQQQQPAENVIPDVPVILFTPPPVDVDAWYKERGVPKGEPNDRANENAKLYGDIVKQVGKELNCSVLDVFDLLGGNGVVQDYGKHLRDGLHLSESGNTLVYEGLMELMETNHPDLAPMTDGQGKYGLQGVPLEGSLWGEMCNRKKQE